MRCNSRAFSSARQSYFGRQALAEQILIGFLAQRLDQSARHRQCVAAGGFQVGRGGWHALADQIQQRFELGVVLLLNQRGEPGTRCAVGLAATVASALHSQMLQALPHQLFKAAVKRGGADRYAKQFTSWDLLITLIYGQLVQAKSLRTLATASQSLEPHRYHLNAKNMVRSTLCDALSKRSSEPFRLACEHLLQGVGRKQRKSLDATITLIDSTSISLRGPGFDEWTSATKTRITQGLKVHVAIDPRQTAPTYVNITATNVSDLSDALTMPLEAGMTYVFDKGYCDYNWWYQINQLGSFFVTRLKKKRQPEAGRKLEKRRCTGIH